MVELAWYSINIHNVHAHLLWVWLLPERLRLRELPLVLQELLLLLLLLQKELTSLRVSEQKWSETKKNK